LKSRKDKSLFESKNNISTIIIEENDKVDEQNNSVNSIEIKSREVIIDDDMENNINDNRNTIDRNESTSRSLNPDEKHNNILKEINAKGLIKLDGIIKSIIKNKHHHHSDIENEDEIVLNDKVKEDGKHNPSQILNLDENEHLTKEEIYTAMKNSLNQGIIINILINKIVYIYFFSCYI